MATFALQKALIDRDILNMDINSVERSVRLNATFPLTNANINTNLKKIISIEASIKEIHGRILNTNPSADDKILHNDEYIAMMDRLDAATVSLVNFQELLGASSVPPPANPLKSVKLPDVKLPSFNSSYEDWNSFADLFKATVDSNPAIRPSIKLQYLKGCCTTGTAEALIKSLTITDANYQIAWDLLEKKFNNKREIVTSVIRKLLNQSALKSESAEGLQTLINTSTDCIRSLQVLGLPVSSWDAILVVHLMDKLDSETRSEWAKTQTTTSPPTMAEFTSFIDLHIRSLLAKGTISNTTSSNPKPHAHKPGKMNSHHAAAATGSQCKLCNGQHYLYRCPKFVSMDPHQRKTAVHQVGACSNCLRMGHRSATCSSSSCKTCGKRHHSMLHFNSSQDGGATDGNIPTSKSTNADGSTTVVQSNTSSLINHHDCKVLLKTAIVQIKDSFGKLRPVRVLLDDGSEASMITSKCANALGVKRVPTDVEIQGIAGIPAQHVHWKANVNLVSRYNNEVVPVEVLIMPRVTKPLPQVKFNPSTWDHLKGLQLADETYHTPGEIDILLGADVVASIMRDGRRTGRNHSPIAQNSLFGWVLSGKVKLSNHLIVKSHHAHLSLEEMVHKFWELSEVPNRKPLTLEEIKCEEHFTNTFARKPDGRYVARLPLNNKASLLGETKELAMRRLFQLEKRFKKYPQQHEAYIQFMDEYLTLGHMEEVVDGGNLTTTAYYIPHHFVMKEDSTTTKLRVVFDASMKSSSGTSLNDALLVGPTIQEDLYSLIIRFRLFHVALKADIAKMYRQFEIHEDDRDYQRILWRSSENEPVKTFRLKTVTYGTASAPFLATRCLNQLATDEADNYPVASAAVKSSMYVDDLLGGAENTKKAELVYQQTTALCRSGGLDIRKWSTSDDHIRSLIPEHLLETNSHDFDDGHSVKALGIKWQPKGDYFHFTVNLPTKPSALTKRHMLSEIAKTFDPIGWITPTTISAKILMQDLWRHKLGWDTSVTDDIKSQWDNYQQQLQLISTLQIPRRIIPPNAVTYQLHGFADSSEKAYAAAIYLRCSDDIGNITCHLVTSRTRVAPLKNTTLPRLELCAAHLLSETMEAIIKSFGLELTLFAWSDSMITLHWIKSASRRWKTFVANRVAAIQEILHPRHWSHVCSADNPADLPSRGITADQLIDNSLWWHGPSWLCSPTFPSSKDDIDMAAASQEEKIITVSLLHATNHFNYLELMSRFSSLAKITNATAWLRRFVNFIRNKATVARGPISPLENKSALHLIIKFTQQQSSKDFANMQSCKQMTAKNKHSQLYPFVDAQGLVRVGGRLQNSILPYDSVHPIILPSSHFITTLLIRQYHHDTLHGGFTLISSMLRRNYWILRGRDAVRFTLRKCVTCRKVKAEIQQQLMGSLPFPRVQANEVFMHCGVDYAGPFNTRRLRGRKSPDEKAYMCVFICFATKAVHLEATTSMSTDGFIAAYKRFIARRGIPSHIYSDCGSNFVGANKELQKLFANNHDNMHQKLTPNGSTWSFNPPSAPHHGGLWEAAVKSAKYHLKRAIGVTPLSLEEFQTLLCNVEACLNSRPLCAMSSDPLDSNALTPGHFLIHRPLLAVPDPDLRPIPSNRLDHWQHITQISQHFWNRWENEYLTTLQCRGKWKRRSQNLVVGDLVVLKDDIKTPCSWKLGRIIHVNPGADSLVRKVTVKTTTGDYIRPISKLSLLLHEDD